MTQLAKEIKQEIKQGRKLREASVWEIFSEVVKRIWNFKEFWIACTFIELGLIVWIRS